MQGKWKKLATATVASAIIAAQAVMQVAAAGGTIDADMSTKIPVLRVAVPTKMAVSVNEFQMADAGSQVYSDEFTMKNLSEIPVSVKVTSTATLGTGVTLVGTRAEAETSTDADNPAMWLTAVAAVAKTGNTLEYAAGDDKTVGALAGTEANATAFTTGDSGSTAVQNFYLQKAEDATYKGIVGAEAEDIGGADFYELTSLDNDDDNAAGAAALAEEKDIYIASTAPVAGTPQALTKIAKGTAAADITWSAGNVAYSIAAAPSADATDVANAAKLYLYVDSATEAAGDEAAFRYAGALSSAKTSWSSANDLKGIEIVYDITGIPSPTYDEIAGTDGSNLTYGYKAEAGATAVAGTKIAKGDGTQISGGAAIATRFQSTAGTQFQFDVSSVDLTDLEVTKIVIDDDEYEFTSSVNSAAGASANSDGKLYAIKNFTASTVSKIELYYGDKYIVTWTIS